jgi:hypothetical protein
MLACKPVVIGYSRSGRSSGTLPVPKTFNETFNDFFNNRVGGGCVACRWRVKQDGVKKGLNPCKTNVKIAL